MKTKVSFTDQAYQEFHGERPSDGCMGLIKVGGFERIFSVKIDPKYFHLTADGMKSLFDDIGRQMAVEVRLMLQRIADGKEAP